MRLQNVNVYVWTGPKSVGNTKSVAYEAKNSDIDACFGSASLL